MDGGIAKRTGGGGMFKKKLQFIVLLSLNCLLTACQGTSGTVGDDITEAISDQYQFAEGVGIFPPGTPILYQMDLSHPVTVENEYASVTLINAVWQDDVIGLRLALADRSAAMLTDEEVRQALKPGSQALDETDGYFCIDSARKLYGRSEYRRLVDSQTNYSGFVGITGRLYGKGFPEDSGCLFDRAPSTVSYDGVSEHGIIMTETELIIEKVGSTAGVPQGTYRLMITGFEKPLEFEFSQVPEFLLPEQIPGIEEREGSYFLVTGRQVGHRLHLLCHILPREGTRFMLLEKEASFEGEIVSPLYHFTLWDTPFSGFHRNNVTEIIYDTGGGSVPEGAELVCDGILLISEEESEVYTLEIPESAANLDIPVKFADSTLYLTGIENKAADEEMQTPSVYISAASADDRKDRDFIMVYALFDEGINASEEELRSFPYGITYPERERKADSIYSGTIKGFRIPYREGEKQLKLKFREPAYYWKETFVLPVWLCDE